ncbi:hypothetical protein QE152_g29533, partial [Popillia japonica]
HANKFCERNKKNQPTPCTNTQTLKSDLEMLKINDEKKYKQLLYASNWIGKLDQQLKEKEIELYGIAETNIFTL